MSWMKNVYLRVACWIAVYACSFLLFFKLSPKEYALIGALASLTLLAVILDWAAAISLRSNNRRANALGTIARSAASKIYIINFILVVVLGVVFAIVISAVDILEERCNSILLRISNASIFGAYLFLTIYLSLVFLKITKSQDPDP